MNNLETVKKAYKDFIEQEKSYTIICYRGRKGVNALRSEMLIDILDETLDLYGDDVESLLSYIGELTTLYCVKYNELEEGTLLKNTYSYIYGKLLVLFIRLDKIAHVNIV